MRMRHVMAIMGSDGDTKKIWNPAIPVEVEDARESFDRLRAKNYLAFEVNDDGSQGKQITEFNPNAGKLILVPQMQGG